MNEENFVQGGKKENPIGTLAILLFYGLLFGAGWLFFYFFIFLPRGPILP